MIRRIIQGFNRYLFYLAAVPLFIMMILTVIDVSGRYFGHPIPGTLEISTISLVLICTWCWAHTQAKKGHIAIDLVLKGMSPRTQAIIDIFTSCIALIIIGIIAWQAIPMMLFAHRLMEWTDRLKLPIWPMKGMLFIGAFCLALQIILDIIDHVKALGKREPAGTAAGLQGTGGTGID